MQLCRLRVSLFVATLAYSAALNGQQSINSATLSGRVIDPSGAVVAIARVEARNTATNQISTTETDEGGRFRFASLPVGPYVITVIKPGFAEVRSSIDLTIGAAFDLALDLPVSTTKQNVEITSEAPLIETVRTQISETIRPDEIENLPLNGRNYLDLALLAPGVSRTNASRTSQYLTTSAVSGTTISISGQRNLGTSFIVDGLSSNDDSTELSGTFYSQEVVREFQVVTSGATAEFGRASSGIINVLTRSGTNQIHGDVYGFLRNQRFDARNALSAKKTPLARTQYGASLGGPIVRDRTFFFSNFEQTRQTTAGIITISPGNVAAINVRLNVLNLPVARLFTGEYATGLKATNYLARVDHEFSPGERLAIRYNLYSFESPNAQSVGGLSAASRGTGLGTLDQTIAGNNTWTISPNVLDETRGQYTRSRLNALPNDLNGPGISIAGVASLGASNIFPTRRDLDLYELSNTVTWQHAGHSLKAGSDVVYNRLNIISPGAVQGVYSFGSLAAFLAGNYLNYMQDFGSVGQFQTNPNLGLFVQDEWRASPSFTVDLGLRYDVEWLNRIVNTSYKNVAPRVGTAWTPFASRRTVFRASYGIFYNRIPLRIVANALQRNGITFVTALLTPVQAGAPKFPDRLPSIQSGGVIGIQAIDPNIKPDSTNQFAAQVEQALSARATLSVGYEHLRGRHIPLLYNANVPTCATGFNLCRPNPNFGNISTYAGRGDSWYDGMTASFEQRPSQWANIRISWTWSKAIDDAGNFFTSTPQNNFNIRDDRGRSDNDQRHRVVVSGALNTPTGSAHNWWERIRNDFVLSGIYSYSSPLPFNIQTGTDNNGDTTLNDRPFGVGHNAGHGFDFQSLDARVSRVFALNERLRLQALVEGFNALNHRNNITINNIFGNGQFPTAPLASFGQPTAVADPRQLQFGLKLTF